MLKEKRVHTQVGNVWGVKNILKTSWQELTSWQVSPHCEFSPTDIEEYRGLNGLLDRLIKMGDRHTNTHTDKHTHRQTKFVQS